MKKMVYRFQKTIVFLLKAALYVTLFLAFFLLMGIENWQLWTLSRTAGITMTTFAVLLLVLVMVYGTYDIGRRKSKPIIYSVALATILTDIITCIQLAIMNTNVANGLNFRFGSIRYLVIAVFIQIILIIIFTYLGNYIYFSINKPEKCCVITSSLQGLDQVMRGIGKYKKQFKVECVKNYLTDDLRDSIFECQTVFIHDVPVKERTEIVEFCYRNSKNIYFTPEITDVVEINAKHVIYNDVSFISSPVKEMSFEQRVIKRLIDFFGALMITIITSPLWLIIAICIKTCDGGKVFFQQNRATKYGRIFKVYKFRTMKENITNHSVTMEDGRITSVGAFLRKYRLDELPQMINILKGEMSLVGPRPEMLENVYMYTREIPEFAYRLRVKAGLTGYAQISGKYNTSPKDKLILDMMYIEEYSIWKDFKLLLQTVVVLLKRDSTEAFNKTMGRDFKRLKHRFEAEFAPKETGGGNE